MAEREMMEKMKTCLLKLGSRCVEPRWDERSELNTMSP